MNSRICLVYGLGCIQRIEEARRVPINMLSLHPRNAFYGNLKPIEGHGLVPRGGSNPGINTLSGYSNVPLASPITI
ncbi:unnamed protein product [Cochlearia groenlandica]